MNFWQIFIRVFWWRPLPALGALWWQLTRRKVRARNRLRTAGAPLPFAYNFWMRNVEQPQRFDERAATAPSTWISQPTFTVVVDALGADAEDLSRTLQSIDEQAYAASQVLVVGDEEPTAVRAVAASNSDYVIPVKAGDRLSCWALFHFAETLQGDPDAVLLYGDEDEIDEAGTRRRPWFKPRWNEELFLARDYVSRACAFRTSSAQTVVDACDGNCDAWPFDLLLHVIATANDRVRHVPRIIAHVPDIERQTPQADRLTAVRRFAASQGGTVTEGPFDSVKVSWPLPAPLPMVSMIVPTRDKLELLRPCVESLLHRTTYDNFELLIVDNGSVDPDTIRYLDELRANPKVRVLPYPLPYNYSAINNHAAREARGSYLCLLNNDTEVVGADWLSEMMRHAVRPCVGAVGAKLLYEDGSIQHAGVIVGIGDAAGHAHRNLPADDAGYFGHAHVTQFISAVTGACLLVDKRKFMAVGGLDQEHLPIAYNDVDFCLKLERAGWRNVYVPHAVLIHHESKSRAKDHAPARIGAYRLELQAFQDRWGAKTYDDPLFNPNLDRSSETFLIRF